jgi:hypothetical protein
MIPDSVRLDVLPGPEGLLGGHHSGHHCDYWPVRASPTGRATQLPVELAEAFSGGQPLRMPQDD